MSSFRNYEYQNFEEVVNFITADYFDDGSLRWTLGAVEVYRRAKENGDLRLAECMGDVIKNCVAVHRLAGDIPDFAQRFKGKSAMIWRGKVSWLEKRGGLEREAEFIWSCN